MHGGHQVDTTRDNTITIVQHVEFMDSLKCIIATLKIGNTIKATI